MYQKTRSRQLNLNAYLSWGYSEKIWHLKQLLHILGVRIGVKHLIMLIPIGEIRAILPNIQMVILVLK